MHPIDVCWFLSPFLYHLFLPLSSSLFPCFMFFCHFPFVTSCTYFTCSLYLLLLSLPFSFHSALYLLPALRLLLFFSLHLFYIADTDTQRNEWPLLVTLRYENAGSNHSLISPNIICKQIFYNVMYNPGGPRWRSWLRHWATSQKVAGAIPDGVIGIFHWHNPSGRTMALGSTQPLTEMSTGNISWG